MFQSRRVRSIALALAAVLVTAVTAVLAVEGEPPPPSPSPTITCASSVPSGHLITGEATGTGLLTITAWVDGIEYWTEDGDGVMHFDIPTSGLPPGTTVVIRVIDETGATATKYVDVR